VIDDEGFRREMKIIIGSVPSAGSTGLTDQPTGINNRLMAQQQQQSAALSGVAIV